MEATKVCPYCSEEILVDAKKCKHCGEFLDDSLRKARLALPLKHDHSFRAEIIPSLFLLLSFFLPWVTLFSFQVSGYEIPNAIQRLSFLNAKSDDDSQLW